MLDEEGALSHLPERPAPPQVGQQLCLGVGEAKQLARLRKLVGRLRVDDLRLRVGEQALGEPELATSLGARGPRSESRWRTTTFWVPRARESLNDCCSHSPMPRLERMRQPSSTTTIRFELRSSVSASIIACSQAVAQVIRIPSAAVCVLRTARRLRTTSGASRSSPRVVGPSNMPRRFPEQSWSSANAIGRTAFAISETSIASASAISALGWTSTSTTAGSVGSPSERRAKTVIASWPARFSSGVSGRSSAAAATE